MVLVALLHLVAVQAGTLGFQDFWGWAGEREGRTEQGERERGNISFSCLKPEVTYVPIVPWSEIIVLPYPNCWGG